MKNTNNLAFFWIFIGIFIISIVNLVYYYRNTFLTSREKHFIAGKEQVQQEAIERGFAIYHPQTKEFTWKNE